jgi:hypothetical protein
MKPTIWMTQPGNRQKNRRVELLVSGEAIGSPVNATTGSLR